MLKSGIALFKMNNYNHIFVSDDTACERCDAGNYCLGDGNQLFCGRCENSSVACDASPTEHSFGSAQECSPCPDGWVRKGGEWLRCMYCT